jgi:NADP-dependent 3-hydroxy acid dehydrogenase YdfG
MTDISGSVVAITGASSGIGEAIALLLAERGARVVLGARRREPLDDLVRRIEASGGTAVALPTDVARREDVAALVALAVDRHGRLDALVSNAGTMPISLLERLRVDDWDAMIDVNLRGVLHGIAAALPVFGAQGAGHFVTVGSTADRKVLPTMAVYAATKTAVRALMDGLRQELAPAGIRATLVSPGQTDTDVAAHITDPTVLEMMQGRAAGPAMPPAAVARAVAYALSEPAEVNLGEIVLRPTGQA